MKIRTLVPWLAIIAGVIAAPAHAQTPKPDAATLAKTGILERLAERTGVYGVPPTAKVPGFIADSGWPQKLPNNWLIGEVGGLYVAPDDHIWVLHRPRSLTTDEAALTPPTQQKGRDGQPVDVLGFPRPYGPLGDCCLPAPAVLEFDSDGKLLRSWGGPGDPDKCRVEEGCIWPAREHGIFVDHNGFVYIGGNGRTGPNPTNAPWEAHHSADGLILKFTKDGKFVMMIGGPTTGPNSNSKTEGKNGTPLFFLPADITIDPATNRMYVADGYGNRRVVVVDAATGKYIGHFGAYGNNPIDDKAAAAAGPWMNDYTKGNMKPAFFRNPVHCVKVSKDGLLYVCDRGNNRIQVFNTKDPNLGKECANASGEAGKCGFVKEQFVAVKTNGLPGSAVSMNFSTDAKQSCLYVGDNSNMTIYVLNRDSLQELGRLGRSGREAGEFHWLHQVSVDSKGNIYTGEVDTGKRIQKFIRYGAEGCSGTGRTTVGGLLP